MRAVAIAQTYRSGCNERALTYKEEREKMMKNSFPELSPQKYQRIEPATGVAPFQPYPAPEPVSGIRRSPVIISSLPIISTNVDGILRQFYGGRNLPIRRIIAP